MREAKTHVLKTWKDFWTQVKVGNKTFEVRVNDRDYQIGDVLILRAVDSKPPYAELTAYGKTLDIEKYISFILHGGQFGIERGYVVLGLGDPSDAVTAYSREAI